jgi:AAA+ superfamily predicted ATPase
MNTVVQRRCVRLRRTATSGMILTLACARHVHKAVDRRMPEAAALAAWLAQHATTFGLPDGTVPDDDDGDRHARARRHGVAAPDWHKIGAALAQAEGGLMPATDTPADHWLTAIVDRLALDSLDARILALGLHYRLDDRLERLFATIGTCRGDAGRIHRNAALIALLLGVPPTEVAIRLTGEAKLLASGLLRFGDYGALAVLERLVSLIRRDTLPGTDIYDQLLGTIAAEPLPWDAFAHLGREAEVAATMLAAALCHRESGINILLYGAPGTGKTSFASTLAAHIGARLRPVAETDEDGGEPDRDQRLSGLRLAQHLAVPGETLLLFDEAEDLFVGRRFMFDEPRTSSRVFMHRLLERMAVPVIWTANDIGALGPAALRRMTMCLELRVPNLATRARLWRRMGEAEGVALQDADAARLARLAPAAPAVASAALRATRLAGGGAETARLIVEGIARAVHGGGLPVPEPEPDTTYDPALINADCDLAALTTDLLREGAPRAVSFLLSGPPGAGKSAWVRYLAGRMGMPMLQKRASDLLDPFVGGTEHNIAGAFTEARDTHAFLVFDEADSLLLERADAVRSWEISQVNEMLTWMESHTLPFACTTNLADRLDRASLRRFLVKLRFDWLTQGQGRLAFQRFFGQPAPTGLDELRTLTPADFALVRRRAAVRGGKTDPAALLRLLAAECEGRLGGRLPVGFAARASGDCDGA